MGGNSNGELVFFFVSIPLNHLSTASDSTRIFPLKFQCASALFPHLNKMLFFNTPRTVAGFNAPQRFSLI
jgi:hypothetical protein